MVHFAAFLFGSGSRFPAEGPENGYFLCFPKNIHEMFGLKEWTHAL
jgi:hypothetical protein